MSAVLYNKGPLQKLILEIRTHRRDVIKVGILPETNARDDGKTNAEVGLKMEFGSKSESEPSAEQMRVRGRGRIVWQGFPARSWLRQPMMIQLPALLRNTGVEIYKFLLLEQGFDAMTEAIGQIAVDTIKTAFSTGGYGSWPANSPRTVKWKGSSQPLIDTHQLENAVTFGVVKNP